MAFSLIGYNSIFGDVAEVGEYHFGYRSEGSIYGVQQFIRKCLAAVANGGVLLLLGLSGFINPIEEIVDGVRTLVQQPQTPAVLFTIQAIIGFVSIVFLIPSTIIAFCWKLTKERHHKLISYLDRKRAGIEVSDEEKKEIDEFCKPLI